MVPHPADGRLYPARPVVGVGGVILVERKVVLVRRRFEPLAGQWSLPGGALELGEPLDAGLRRELVEETGLEVEVGPVIDVFDRILRDHDRRVRFHYVLVDYLCWPLDGELQHGSDVDAVALVDPHDLERYAVTEKATEVIRRGLEMDRQERP